ncbi:dihydroneopterin aldolase 2-like [Arachis hypogaea]|uniref:7,8-dihydroneopterin aldolase n=1 Tax=Arachis hypogaea TaxID=3818 RepID=A0A445B2M3_ARAHY|nr:Dihydroneopterin aldolase [Arachis hypogaea]RYR32900.1 hypothetical protein Ahy_A10g047430 [Arachis hypogaea]
MDADALITGDKLIPRGCTFYGFHGAIAEERVLGQKFLVNIDAWMDVRASGISDHLSDTVSYAEIYGSVITYFIAKEIIEGKAHILLESVAQKIAITTLTQFPHISAIRVNVGKPQVAVRGPVDYLGVQILRRRSDLLN